MKREEIKTIFPDATDEQLKAVMDLNGADVEKVKGKVTALEAEIKEKKEAIKKLGDREQHILKLRFFEGKTQMEVAEEIQISQAQVSRLEKSALKNMKNYLSLTR